MTKITFHQTGNPGYLFIFYGIRAILEIIDFN